MVENENSTSKVIEGHTERNSKAESRLRKKLENKNKNDFGKIIDGDITEI